jgi:hypothetical protein
LVLYNFNLLLKMGGCLSSPPLPSYDDYYNDLKNGDGNRLKFVPRDMIDVDLCIHAINNGLSLEKNFHFIPEKLYGDELFLKIIQLHIENIRYIPKKYINRVILNAFFNHKDFAVYFNPDVTKYTCMDYIDFSIDGVPDIFFNIFKNLYYNYKIVLLMPQQYHTWEIYDFLSEKDIRNKKYLPLDLQPYLRASIFKENDLNDRSIVDKEDAELLFKLCVKSRKYQTFYMECFNMIEESLRTPLMYNYLVIQDLTNINLVPDEIKGELNVDDIIASFTKNTKNTELDIRDVAKFYQIIPPTYSNMKKVDVFFIILNEETFDMIPNERKTLSFFSNLVHNIYWKMGSEKYMTKDRLNKVIYEKVLLDIPPEFLIEDANMLWQVARLFFIHGLHHNYINMYQNVFNYDIGRWEEILNTYFGWKETHILDEYNEPIFTEWLCERIKDDVYTKANWEKNCNPNHYPTTLKKLCYVPRLRDDDFFRILYMKKIYNYLNFRDFIETVPTERKTKEFYLKVINYIFEHNDTAFFDYVFPELKEVFKDDLMVLQNILLFQRTNVLEKKCDCERKC